MLNVAESACVTLHIYAPPLAAEFLNPDLGYCNSVELKETVLPHDVVRYLMASPAVAQAMPSLMYQI
jgi:hypothetical protein